MLLLAAGVGEAQIDELGLFLLQEIQGIGRRGHVGSLAVCGGMAKAGLPESLLCCGRACGSGALSYCNGRAKSERRPSACNSNEKANLVTARGRLHRLWCIRNGKRTALVRRPGVRCPAPAAGLRRGAIEAILPRPSPSDFPLDAVETPPDVSGPDPGVAALLGRPGLRDPAALRHADGRRHLPRRHLSAGHRPGALERRLRAAQPAARPMAAMARTRTGCSTTTSSRW